MTNNHLAGRIHPVAGGRVVQRADGRLTVDILLNPQMLSGGDQAARDALIHMLHALRGMTPQARVDALGVLTRFAALSPRVQRTVLEAVTAMNETTSASG